MEYVCRNKKETLDTLLLGNPHGFHLPLAVEDLRPIGWQMRQSQLIHSLTAVLMLSITAQPVKAAGDDELQLARRYLRCAAFYLSGSNEVSKPELKQQLQHLTNVSLYSAEILLDKDRPRVKNEFDTARKNLIAETQSDEVKADTRGFMQYMGEHCAELRKKHPVPLPDKGS
jgi:hypothetical protein